MSRANTIHDDRLDGPETEHDESLERGRPPRPGLWPPAAAARPPTEPGDAPLILDVFANTTSAGSPTVFSSRRNEDLPGGRVRHHGLVRRGLLPPRARPTADLIHSSRSLRIRGARRARRARLRASMSRASTIHNDRLDGPETEHHESLERGRPPPRLLPPAAAARPPTKPGDAPLILDVFANTTSAGSPTVFSSRRNEDLPGGRVRHHGLVRRGLLPPRARPTADLIRDSPIRGARRARSARLHASMSRSNAIRNTAATRRVGGRAVAGGNNRGPMVLEPPSLLVRRRPLPRCARPTVHLIPSSRSS